MHYREIDFARINVNLAQIKALSKAIPFQDLQTIYRTESARLSALSRKTTIRTHSELVIHGYFSNATKLKIFPSFWIGNSCFDFFIPSIGGEMVDGNRKMRGLAIEVDGLVHQYEGKMKKDENKITMLSKLGIGLVNIENCDIHALQTNRLIESIKKCPVLIIDLNKRF